MTKKAKWPHDCVDPFGAEGTGIRRVNVEGWGGLTTTKHGL